MSKIIKDPWVNFSKVKGEARFRLFCFPYAGGAASAYRQWHEDLPPHFELCAVQIPGRENRIFEPLFTDLQPLVKALVAALERYFDLPFLFFGHSMGSLIAFELCRELRREKKALPKHLLVSGRGAPHIVERGVQLHRLKDAEFIDKLREYNGTPEAILQNKELMELLLPILRADFQICETYHYQEEEPFSFGISAFGGDKDHVLNIEELTAWQKETTDKFRYEVFEGDHFYLNLHRHLLLKSISQDLKALV